MTRMSYYFDEVKKQIEQGNLAGAESLINAIKDNPASDFAPMHTALLAWYQAKLLYSYGRLEQAGAEVRKAILLLTNLSGQESTLAKAINLLGNIYLVTGQVIQATLSYQHAVEVATANDDSNLAVAIMVNLSMTQMNLDASAAAFRNMEQAQRLAEQSGDIYTQAVVCNQLALMYSVQGPFSQAIRWAEAASQLQAQLPQVSERVTILITTATIYFKYGDHLRASQLSDEVEMLTLAHPDLVGRDAVLILKTGTCKLAGDLDGWRDLALMSWQSTATLDRNAEAANQLARYYTRVGQYEQARLYVAHLKGDGMDERPPHAEDIDRLDAAIYAAEGSWDLSDRHYRSSIDQLQGVIDNYNLAEVKEEYALMLWRWAEATANPTLAQQGLDLAEQALALFEVLELPQRISQMQTTIDSLTRLVDAEQ